LPLAQLSYTRWQPSAGYTTDSNLNRNWYFSKYIGFAAGFGYINGASSSILSLPIGLQINHPLNNNLVAFAGISVAPTFYGIHSLTDPLSYKSIQNPYLSNTYGFGADTGMEMGLMYTNDAKTFSISGSIGIDRYYSPVYPAVRSQDKKP
jgi:hypothetical protein